uniref:Uncharacterized protein n=1 Tax=Micrurus surinamensis TaxID=129470 RepID=A0A2D4PQQ7_MICSU
MGRAPILSKGKDGRPKKCIKYYGTEEVHSLQKSSRLGRMFATCLTGQKLKKKQNPQFPALEAAGIREAAQISYHLPVKVRESKKQYNLGDTEETTMDIYIMTAIMTKHMHTSSNRAMIHQKLIISSAHLKRPYA